MKKKKISQKKCKHESFYLLRYAEDFNLTVHPSDPDRMPKKAIYRCEKCGLEQMVAIRHR